MRFPFFASLAFIANLNGSAAAQIKVPGSDQDKPAHLRFTLKGQPVTQSLRGVHYMALSSSGAYLAGGDHQGTLTVWDAVKGTRVFKDTDPNKVYQPTWVGPMVFTSDSKMVIAANDRGQIKLWHTATGKPAGELPRHEHSIHLLSYLAEGDGQTLVSGDSSGKIRFWDMNTRKELPERGVHLGKGAIKIYAEQMAVSRDGKTIFSAERGQRLTIWDVPTAKQKALLEHEAEISCFAVTPDEKTLIVSVSEHRASYFKVWDLKTRQVRLEFDGPYQAITALQVTKDGRTLITGCRDGSVKLFDLASGGERLDLHGTSTAGVGGLAVSADGKTIAAGRYDDNTISLWQLPSSPSTIAARAVKKHKRTLPWDSKERRALRREADILAGEGPKGIATLAAKLDGDDPNGRYEALRALQDLGPHAAGALDAIIRLVKNEDCQLPIKQLAIEVLTGIGPAARKALPALATATRETRDFDGTHTVGGPSNVSEAAILAIIEIDERAILPLIQEKLAKGKSLGLPNYLIRKLGPATEPLLPKVRELLKGDGRKQFHALSLLPLFGDKGMDIFADYFFDPTITNGDRLVLAYELRGQDISGPSTIRIYQALLKDDDIRLRSAAVEKLQYWRVPQLVPDLLRLLDDAAIDSLTEALANQGKDAAPGLAKALTHEKPRVRDRAVTALSKMKKYEAKAAIPALEKLLRDDSFRIRTTAAKAILKSGQESAAALAVLEEHLQGNDRSLGSTLRIVGELGAAGRPLFAAVKRVTLDVKSAGLETMQKIHGDPKEIVEVWTQIVQKNPLFVRLAPIEELHAHGRHAQPAVPSLIATLKDRQLRRAALEALTAIGPAAAPAIPELLKLLVDEDFYDTARALGAMREQGGPAAVPLMKRFDQIKGDKNAREPDYKMLLILEALEKIGPGSAEVVPRLIELIPDHPHAIQVLGRVGPKAKAAIPALEKIYRSEKGPLKAWSAFALVKITGRKEPYVASLAEQLGKSKQRSHREAAIQALVALGPDARAALPELLEAVKEKGTFEFRKVDFRHQAALALVNFGSDARPAVPHLIALAEANPWNWAAAAAEAMGAIGPDARAAIPALLKIAEDEERHYRVIEKALVKIRGK